jgi:hypothetical protein
MAGRLVRLFHMKGSGPAVIGLVGIVAFIACATASYLHPPSPLVHDEFSYLLAGDTFASGRLANPSPPAWEHFETIHTLLQPTYASKFPPGQGLVLALGQRIAGRPIVGVWLSMAAAAMAVCWMLRGWMTGQWPLVGGMAAALHPMLVELWGNTYWGGAVALTGGALVYGALPRLLERPTRRSATALGIGLGLLALSRPYEGLVASLPAVFVLSLRLLRGGEGARRTLRAIWLPLLITLTAVAGFLGAHNRAVTGSAWRLPYAEYFRQYDVVPSFLFLPLSEIPDYRHEVQRRFFLSENDYLRRRTVPGFLAGCGEKMVLLSRFYAGWSFVIVGLGVLLALSDRRVRFALGCAALFALALCVETFETPHYAAPFVAIGAFLWVRGLQAVWEWRGGRPAVRIAAAFLVATGFWLHTTSAIRQAKHRASYPIYRRHERIEWLEKREGDHLVIVRYDRWHNYHIEWVQNEADIESARVVWAHEMDPHRTAELLRAFPERTAWLLRPDRRPVALLPYKLGESRPR